MNSEEDWLESLRRYSGFPALVGYLRTTLSPNRCPALPTLQRLITLACVFEYCNGMDELHSPGERPINLQALDILYELFAFSDKAVSEALVELVGSLVKSTRSRSVRKRQRQTLDFRTPESSPKKMALTPSSRQTQAVLESVKREPGEIWEEEEHDTVLGYKLLHLQLQGDLWAAFIAGFQGASVVSTELKAQACWKSWRPILEFSVSVMERDLETLVESTEEQFLAQTVESGSLIGTLFNNLNTHSATLAVQDFVERVFSVTREDTRIRHVYDQELKTSKKFMLNREMAPANDFPFKPRWEEDIKLGIDSIPLRRRLVLLLSRFLDLKFSKQRERDHAKNRLLDELVKKLSLCKYLELQEFLSEKNGFLEELAVRLLECYCGEHAYDELDQSALLDWQTKSHFVNFSLTEEPEVKSSFSFFFECTAKTTLLFSYLIEPESEDAQQIEKGDSLRKECVKNYFSTCKPTAKEKARFTSEVLHYVTLSE